MPSLRFNLFLQLPVVGFKNCIDSFKCPSAAKIIFSTVMNATQCITISPSDMASSLTRARPIPAIMV